MASYTKFSLTIFFVSFVAVNAETKYKFHYEKPSDYPNYEEEQYTKLLNNVQFPKRVPSKESYEKNCNSDDIDRFCCSVTTFQPPYKLSSTEGLNKWVIQSEFFQQTIPETRCKKEGSKCFKDFTDFMDNYQATCKTNTGYISVLVHERGDEKFEWMTVPIDVSCSCHLTPK